MCVKSRSVLIVGGLYAVLWGKGKEINSVGNVVGKSTEEENDDEDGGIILPIYSNASREASGGVKGLKDVKVNEEASAVHPNIPSDMFCFLRLEFHMWFACQPCKEMD
ncbi:hypothetical protein ACLOJK_026639 [Asimina triloba]